MAPLAARWLVMAQPWRLAFSFRERVTLRLTVNSGVMGKMLEFLIVLRSGVRTHAGLTS
jgi:hypothetical protein